MGIKLTIIKVFIILVLLVRIGNILTIFKINQKALCLQLSVRVYSLFGQTEGCKKGSHIVRLPPRALGCHKRWKSLFFCEICEIILQPSSFFYQTILQISTAGHWTLDFYYNFVDRFQDISKVKNPAASKAKVQQLLRAFKGKCFWGNMKLPH